MKRVRSPLPEAMEVDPPKANDPTASEVDPKPPAKRMRTEAVQLYPPSPPPVEGSQTKGFAKVGEVVYTPLAGGLVNEEHSIPLTNNSSATVKILRNKPSNNTKEDLMDLVNLKVVFARQLPKMPKDYICRLVMDRQHVSICLKKNYGESSKVIGGICIRPFKDQKFAEIVFLAVASHEQVQGFGTHMMNHLKEYVKQFGIEYFLTYADNYAIGYFKKQGFTKDLSISTDQWQEYIKDYDGGMLMQCRIYANVPFLDISGMLRAQREAVRQEIKKFSKQHVVHEGYTCFREGVSEIPIEDIRGVKESGWKPMRYNTRHGPQRTPEMRRRVGRLGAILKRLKNHKDSWAFLQPVDRTKVPDYYDIVLQPMDLSTMDKRLDSDQYITDELFHQDFQQIIKNASLYNEPHSNLVKCAKNLQQYCEELCVAMEADRKKREEEAKEYMKNWKPKPKPAPQPHPPSVEPQPAPTPTSTTVETPAAPAAVAETNQSPQLPK